MFVAVKFDVGVLQPDFSLVMIESEMHFSKVPKRNLCFEVLNRNAIVTIRDK